jgi:hypothetical protein
LITGSTKDARKNAEIPLDNSYKITIKISLILEKDTTIITQPSGDNIQAL